MATKRTKKQQQEKKPQPQQLKEVYSPEFVKRVNEAADPSKISKPMTLEEFDKWLDQI